MLRLKPALVLSALVPLAAACSSITKEPWYRDGQLRGTVFKEPKPGGFELRYVDLDGSLARLERRDAQERLVAGVCATEFGYDGSRRLTEERFVDAADRLAPGGEGFAVHTVSYDDGGGQGRLEEHRYFDAGRRPTATLGGFHLRRLRFEPSGARLKKLELRDTAGRPAPAAEAVFGVEGACEAEYSYLQGVGVVVYATYYGMDGTMLAKRRLSGVDSVAYTYQNQPQYSYYNPYGVYSPATTRALRAVDK